MKMTFSRASDEASKLAKDERLSDEVRIDAADTQAMIATLILHFQESQGALNSLSDVDE